MAREENALKIAWLANVQPPYREPMWREVAARSELKVSFMFREEEVRHFVWRDSADYRSSIVRARKIPLPRAVARRFGEHLAILGPGVTGEVLRGADALIIHTWWQPAYLWCMLRARFLRIPYLIYSESTLQSRQFRRGPAALLRSLVFRNAGAVLVPGSGAAEAAIADGTPRERVVETINSIDLDLFDRRVRELRAGKVPDAEHRFLYIGQLIARKNVGSLIRAFAAARGSGTLEIAGDGVEQELLTALARELGVEDRIRFHGFLEEVDVVRLLARSHTLILPSVEEVYGFTALEAYVAGLQVIVSRRAGVASNLAGRPGTWVVDPSQVGVCSALEEAQDQWSGWREDGDHEFASPQRAARDILRAVDIARRS